MEGLIIIFLFWILPIILSFRVSKQKNRNYIAWTLFTVVFGWFATILLLIQTKLDTPPKY